MQDFRSFYYLFFDTEFANFSTLSPLSIGIVSEDKKIEFYKEVSDFEVNDCSNFVKDIVIPLMDLEKHGLPYKELSQQLIKWINDLPCKEVVFVADYDGDIIILERILSELGELSLKKKVSIKLINKAFNQATIERGLYNQRIIHKAFEAMANGISNSLSQKPKMQHHALYDAHANCDGWIQAIKLLEKY